MAAPPKISLPLVTEALGLPETATETDVLETARAHRAMAQHEPTPVTHAGARQALDGLRVELLQRRERALKDPHQAYADMTDLAERIERTIKALGL